MSTLFSKIQPLITGGIPRQRIKIDELVDRVNWLCGIHTINGLPMSDTTTGPRIDLSDLGNPTPNQVQPWLTDPNGNPAGWIQWNVCIAGVSTPVWIWGQVLTAGGSPLG